MKPRVWIPLLLFVLLAFAGWEALQWRNQPPLVSYTTALRETITSAVSTNGRVEPSAWGVARSESAGLVTEVHAALNASVKKGAILVTLNQAQAKANLEGAKARVAQIEANLEVLNAGGPSAQKAELDAQIENLRVDLAAAQRNYERTTRLASKQAATKTEVQTAKDRIDQIETNIDTIEMQIDALVSPGQMDATKAQLQEARASVNGAEQNLADTLVRAPLSGTVYQFDIKPGDYLSPGQEVASIGQLDMLHVKVFVDEPDLGRVEIGKPVTITWDGLPGRDWSGTVDRRPTEIVPRETRQVGEVLCIIDNPDHTLIPGTNVNVLIESETAKDAITIPKEALFRLDGELGVYIITGSPEDTHLEWFPVTQGVNNVTRTQVSGLKEGDRVALPSSVDLDDGMRITPVAE